MGKGSRNRQVRTDDMIANPQNYVQKKTKKSASKNWTSIITIAVVIFVALAIVFGSIASGGTFLRAQKAISSEHYTVTGTMMSYFVYTVFSSHVSQYEQMYSSLLQSYADYSVYDLMGIKQGVSLKEQVVDATTGQTWFDYFMEQARTQVEDLLLYCEGARAAGITLDEEDEAEIELSIAYLEAYASMNKISLKSYLSNMYGKGVNEKDIRKALEISTLATKFVEKLSADARTAAQKADVDAFYAEHEDTYLSADYLTYAIDAKLTAEMTAEEITAAKTAADEAAAKLLAAKTADEYREAVKAYLTETMEESDDRDTKIQAELDKLAVEDVAHTNATKLGEWLFGVDDAAAAGVNTTHKIVTDTTTEEKDEDESSTTAPSYKIATYFVTRAASRNEALTYDISYLALPSTAYKLEDADAALQEFVGAGATKEVLLGMNTKYENHAGCTSIESARPGYFVMDDVDNWIFNTERKAGDYSMLTGKSGDNTYYFIVLIDGISEQVWYEDCLDDLVESKVDEWLEEAQKTSPVKVNEKALNNIDM